MSEKNLLDKITYSFITSHMGDRKPNYDAKLCGGWGGVQKAVGSVQVLHKHVRGGGV